MQQLLQVVPEAEGMHYGSEFRLARFRGDEDERVSASGDDIRHRFTARGIIFRRHS